MVGGFCIAVTKVPRVSQCAETHRIAWGLGIFVATPLKLSTNSFSSIAFIGLPWPKNNTGIFSVLFKAAVILVNSFNFIAAPANGITASIFMYNRLMQRYQDRKSVV